jgi:hypothetical protein
MEALRIACGPDLLPDYQVKRVDAQRRRPGSDGAFDVARGPSTLADLQELGEALMASNGIRGVSDGSLRSDPGAPGEPLDHAPELSSRNLEAAEFRITKDALLVDKESVGDYLEAKKPGYQATLVHPYRERGTRGLDKRSRAVAAVMLQGDGPQDEGCRVGRFPESLPPGQLFATASPGAPEEEEGTLPPQVSYRHPAAVEKRQPETR